jgi:hypothetical protein
MNSSATCVHEDAPLIGVLLHSATPEHAGTAQAPTLAFKTRSYVYRNKIRTDAEVCGGVNASHLADAHASSAQVTQARNWLKT